jgi:CRP-like cAMP-binding protein
MSEPLGAGMEETENRNGAFPRLDDQQRARLRALGKVRKVRSGEVLFRDGEAGYDFFVVESGVVAIVQGYGRENRVIAVHGPHRFLGELNLLTGSRVYLSAVVRNPGEVIQVPTAALRTLAAEDEELTNLILRAYLARRTLLIEHEAGVKVVGSRYSRDTRRLREFLQRNRMPYKWMDLETDEEADALLRALGVESAETPVVLGGDGVLRNPSNAELAVMLGLGARGAPPAMCDLVIVGGGPAGLAAALSGASEGLDTQAIDAVAFGGQASTSARIENYLGFPGGISGSGGRGLDGRPPGPSTTRDRLTSGPEDPRQIGAVKPSRKHGNAPPRSGNTRLCGGGVLEHERDSLSRPYAYAENAVADLAQAQLGGEREDVAGARGPEGVPDGHRTAVGVQALVGDLEAFELAR